MYVVIVEGRQIWPIKKTKNEAGRAYSVLNALAIAGFYGKLYQQENDPQPGETVIIGETEDGCKLLLENEA